MPDQNILTAAQNAELDQLISTTMQLMGASSSYDMKPRDQTGNTTLFGEYRIDNKNQFLRYSQLSLLTPHTFIPLAKLGLSIVSGFRLESEDQSAKEELESWGKRIKLRSKVQNMARCAIRDGTMVAYLPGKKEIENIHIQPMQFTTLLPEGITPGEKVKSLMKGEIVKAVLMESEAKKSTKDSMRHTEMDRDEFALIRMFHEGYSVKDILGRDTYGIYGISLLEPLTRVIKNHSDLTEGFSSNMRRYGVGRLHIKLKSVNTLRAAGQYEKAKDLLESTIAALQKLGPNEDFVTGDDEVHNVSGTNAPQVREMKESFQTDMHIGLLQSPIGMGNTKGSTYASGYLSEEDRYIILESLQEEIKNVVQEEIIDKQLGFMNKEPGTVTIEFDKLDAPYVDYPTLTDARLSGDITQGEYRNALGFPEELPDDR